MWSTFIVPALGGGGRQQEDQEAQGHPPPLPTEFETNEVRPFLQEKQKDQKLGVLGYIMNSRPT